MKTRIIQNEPEQPAENAPTAETTVSGPRQSTNVAARMSRWSARHRKIAIFGWLVFVIASFAMSIAILPMQTIKPKDAAVGEAGKANQILDRAFDLDKTGLGEFVVIQSKTKTVDDPAFRATIGEAVDVLSGFKKVDELQSPLVRGNEGQVSPDRHAALITFSPRGSYDEAKLYIDRISAAIADVQTAHPDFYVGEAGVSTRKAVDELVNSGIAKAGMIALPLTFAILLLVLGSAVAALVPLLVGLTSVLATLGLVSLPSQLVPMEAQVSHVILLIGLAVGVDYSLFYLRREREERRAGRREDAALAAAAATSGRAVLISGFTVIIAMAGMLLSGDKTFMSFAIGTMMVVAVAMVGSLTVLPAVLSKLGDRVEKGRIPFLHRLRRDSDEGGRLWGAILRPVLRHPVISTIASAAVLVLLALPALQLHTADSGLDALPKSQPELQAFRAIDAAFPGGATAAVVAIKAEDGTGIRMAIADLKTKALASGEMQNPIQVEKSPGGSAFQVNIPLAGEGVDEVSNHALATLRDEILPATVGTVPDAEYAVGGPAAQSHDFNAKVKSSAPLVFGFVLLFAFLLLLFAFRSIVISLTAIVLNLLSVAAAYGMLVAIFQWGWGENLLDFNSTGGIASWLPLFLFVILFGLSMDYHVFILSRIREAFDRGLKTEDAVEHGIRTSAGVVTGASIVMVGVFSVFAILPLLDLKEMGIGLAAAILIDATIVRAVLLPATMKLLGDTNWYLPKRLGWLPRLEHETEAPAEVAPAPAPAA
jgi:RND superfamily putative drug exporter